jgi:xanthine dehydrogenase accessory factor
MRLNGTGTGDDLRQEAERLRAARRPFVQATVVRAERPTSARPGDRALVLDDGTILGFVGGECAQASVQAQALVALESGDPVLLRIRPEDPDADGDAGAAAPPRPEAGAVTVHNPCLSGGTLEIFLEPSVPPALVVVHGDAPIARAVRELAGWLGFDARAGSDIADTSSVAAAAAATTARDAGPVAGKAGPAIPNDPGAAVGATHGGDDAATGGGAGPAGGVGPALPEGTAVVVVATHGGDEAALISAALDAGVGYVGLVASERRGEAVLSALDLGAPERARVHTPAGLAIGAVSPQAVALSVLAEIVSVRPEPEGHHAVPAKGPEGAATAVDPVCGMTVAAVESTRHLDRDGARYWFCGPGCEQAFTSA